MTAYFSLKTITEYQRLHLTTFNLPAFKRKNIYKCTLCCQWYLPYYCYWMRLLTTWNLSWQCQEEVVRSNGMISRGKLNKWSRGSGLINSETLSTRPPFEMFSKTIGVISYYYYLFYLFIYLFIYFFGVNWRTAFIPESLVTLYALCRTSLGECAWLPPCLA